MNPCVTAVVYVLVCVVGIVSADPPVWLHQCAPPQTRKLADYLVANGTVGPPELPPVPSSYQVRVEVNILNKNKTIVSHEYFDADKKRVAIRSISNNREDFIILDYNMNEIIYSRNGECFADNLKRNLNFVLYGVDDLAVQSAPPKPHDYSLAQILKLAYDNGMTYMGRQVIRGILCDWWTSCMYWPNLQSNFTLDYYFSAVGGNWIEPDLSPSVPVRAVIRGVRFDMEFGEVHFHHMYEYFDFRHLSTEFSIWRDESVFETPAGVICKNRNQTRPVPKLPGQYSYREEAVIYPNMKIYQSDVYYDYSHKLIRVDYRPEKKMPPFYNTNPFTEIHDYSTGISYNIDRTLGNCTMTPIQNTSLDSSLQISVNVNNSQQFFLKMKSPKQFLFLDSTSYTYEGQRFIRDIPCDVFIAKRSDFRIQGFPPFNSTFEIYFLSKKWTESSNMGKTVTSRNVPLQLIIRTPPLVGLQLTYNIYNFDADDPSHDRFDVTSCYNTTTMKPFVITFPGKWDVSMAQYQQQFPRMVTAKLAQIAGVPLLRIQKADIQWDMDKVTYRAILLATPPPMAYFRKMPGNYHRVANDKNIPATRLQDCALACNDDLVLMQCGSFDFCESFNECGLSRSHTQDGGLVQGNEHCSHYVRTVEKNPLDVDMYQAFKKMKNSVLAGQFVFTIPIENGDAQFTATNIEGSGLADQRRDMATQAIISQFRMQTNKAMKGARAEILTDVSVDDCAYACLQRRGWVCNALTYCFSTSYCILSKQHPDDQPDALQDKPNCDVYSRKYTVDYEMIPGVTVLSSSPSVYQDTMSAEACAKLCNTHTDFNCKSFDYCDMHMACYLGKAHYYDVPLADRADNPACNHYSRNYLSDFQKTSSQEMTNTANRIIHNVHVTECAKLCVEEESISCASFGYCGNTTDCRLSTASMRNVGQVSAQTSMWCDIYSRQSFPDGTPYINNPQKYYNMDSSSSGYSSGSMAGLGFGMLLLGGLLVAGGYMLYRRIRKKYNDKEVAIHFVKTENDM